MARYALWFDFEECPEHGIRLDILNAEAIPTRPLSAMAMILVDWMCKESELGFEEALDRLPKAIIANRADVAHAQRARRKGWTP